MAGGADPLVSFPDETKLAGGSLAKGGGPASAVINIKSTTRRCSPRSGANLIGGNTPPPPSVGSLDDKGRSEASIR
jgi:hypothetical protein